MVLSCYDYKLSQAANAKGSKTRIPQLANSRANGLLKDEARRIAANIAKSLELLRRTILNRVGPATPPRIEFANALIT